MRRKSENSSRLTTLFMVTSQDSSDAEVIDHLACGAKSKGLSWLSPFEIFRVEEIPLKGVTLVEPVDANKRIDGCTQRYWKL